MGLQEHVIVAGNPGSGKSSILNSIIGKVKFESGISFGEGLTTALDSKKINGILYSDTPGLDDHRIRETAAKEISDAFRKGGKTKLIFVSTLEAGRLRTNDLATMKTILQAIEEVGVDPSMRFSIIFNKCEKEVLAELKDNEQRARIEVGLNSMAPAGRIAYMPFRSYAFGKNNVLVTKDSRTYKEFVRTAPAFELRKNKSFKVDPASYDTTIQQLKKMVDELRRLLDEVLTSWNGRPRGGFRRFINKLGSQACNALDAVFNSHAYTLK